MTVSAGERRAPISTTSGSRQHPLGHRLDFRRQRRGKEERLPVLGHVFDDPAHVREKAHVEHAIDFIEHEILDVLEIRGAVLEEIEQAPRRGDEDVHARRELLPLLAVADAAVDDCDLQIREAGVIAKSGLHLRGQFAGRLEDERARRPVLASFVRIGRANAAVLPVPVWAEPIMSLPSRTIGKARSWIGVGST